VLGITAFAQTPFAALPSVFGDVSENIVLTEAQVGVVDFPVSRDETFTLLDAQTGVVDYLVAANESFTLFEFQDVTADFVGAVSETQTLTEEQTVQADFLAAVSETQTLTEVQNVSAAFAAVRDESITLTTDEIGNVDFPVAVNEVLALVELDSDADTDFLVFVVDDIFLNTSQNVIATFEGIVDETETLTDVQTGNLDFLGNVAETMTLTEVQAAQTVFIAQITEVLTIADSSVTVQAIFAGSVVEIMTVSDSQCIFGWFKIDDTQDASWGITTITLDEVAVYGGDLFGGLSMAGTDKKTTTAPSPINTDQNPNWTHVDDTNGTSWTEVDSNQNC
jgi:hypothetical protein